MKTTFSIYRTLILVFFASLVLGQFERLTSLGLPSIYFHEIILIVLNLLLVADSHFRPTYLVVIKTAKLWWLFSGALALSLLVNSQLLNSLLLPASLYLARFMLYSSLVPICVTLSKDPHLKRWLRYSLPLMLFAMAILGITQYLIYPDTRALFWLGWDKHYYRSIGTIFDPNFLGLLMAAGLFLTAKIPSKWQWWYASVLVICLLLTYSRSSYLALVAGAFVLALRKHQVKTFFLGIVAFASMLLVLPNRGGEGNRLDRVYSALNRLESVKQAYLVYTAHPLFGIGFNAYTLTQVKNVQYAFIPQRTSSPDNSYLLILATSGIIGLFGFGLCLRQVWAQNQAYPYAVALWSTVLVHSLFNNSLFYPWVMVCLGVVTGTSYFKEKTSH